MTRPNVFIVHMIDLDTDKPYEYIGVFSSKEKADLAGKIDKVFDDELQKDIVDELNKNIDIPFINEKMEEKGLNFLYDVFEEKIKTAFKKAL